MKIEYILADSTQSEKEEFAKYYHMFFEFDHEQLRVNDQILLETSEGNIWYKIYGRIFVNDPCDSIKLIIQLKPI